MKHRPFQFLPYPIPAFAEYDKRSDKAHELQLFVEVSVALTGFSDAELQSTGLIQAYFDELALVVGRTIRGQFLQQAATAPGAVMQKGNLWQPWRRTCCGSGIWANGSGCRSAGPRRISMRRHARGTTNSAAT